jgi:hypothetical protein
MKIAKRCELTTVMPLTWRRENKSRRQRTNNKKSLTKKLGEEMA